MGRIMKGKGGSAEASEQSYLQFDFFQPPAVDAQEDVSPAMQRLLSIMHAPSAAHARARCSHADFPKPLVYRDMGLLVYLRDIERFRPKVIATRPPRLTSAEVALETRAALYTAIRSLPTASSCWLLLETGGDDVRYSVLLAGMRGVSKAARLVHVPHHPSSSDGAWSVLMVMRTEDVVPQIDLPCFALLEDDATQWHEPKVNEEILDGLLAASASEGSLAADPFAGDGRLLCAARRVGLCAYGHETAPPLLKRAAARGVQVRSLYSEEATENAGAKGEP